MHRISVLTVICFLFGIISFGQSPVLCFDGIDDYVDIGDQVGNNARTVECWFKLDNGVDSSLPSFKAIIARELNVNTNEDEFNIAFVPSTLANAGKLRWNVQPLIGQERLVFSDSDSWLPNRWYHVAGVVHPTLGMMLFIDGVKQQDTDTHTSSTQSSPASTTIGSWGQVAGRYFEGCIEDVRISSDALYITDFTPPCPDIQADVSTTGLFNLNEGVGVVTADSSALNQVGVIFGATWSTAKFCAINTAVAEVEHEQTLVTFYPNPTNGMLSFHNRIPNVPLVILSIDGRFIGEVPPNTLSYDMSAYPNGMYLLQEGSQYAGRVVKQ